MTSRSQQLSGAWDPTNTAKQRAGRADRSGPEQNPTDSPTAPQRERADLSAPRPSCWRREIRLRLGRAGFWEGFSVLFFSIVSQFLVKSVSGLDLHQLGALDSVHGASSPGKRAAHACLPVPGRPRCSPGTRCRRHTSCSPLPTHRHRNLLCELSIASELLQRMGNPNARFSQRQKQRPTEGKK